MNTNEDYSKFLDNPDIASFINSYYYDIPTNNFNINGQPSI